MEALLAIVGVVVGAVLGWLAGFALAGRRAAVRIAETNATLEAERRATAEKLALLRQAEEQLRDTFRALSSEALRESSQSFLDLARLELERFHAGAQEDLARRQGAVERLVQPLQESLTRVTAHIQELEKARAEAYGGLASQVRSLATVQERLQAETANLVRALSAPSARGRWGEIQLRRVVELAGMVAHCDFVEQKSVQADGGRLRPDLLVRLPGGKQVVVDAKAPLRAFLEALEAPDETIRKQKLQEHARQVRAHLLALAQKSYWEEFQPSPEFVVLFLPGESFFGAALEQDPGLIEEGVQRGVILATPTTLIALLRAVAYGWKQEQLAENAVRISDEGRVLYERIRTFAAHFEDLRAGLERAVEAYNSAAGSLELRVLPAARRLKDFGAGSDKELTSPSPVQSAPRVLALGEGDAPGVK
jgi:DNA recombination protein RmuC